MKYTTKNFYGEVMQWEDDNGKAVGFFEHKEYGDEYGGGLRFEYMSGTWVLDDYDGIPGYIPNEVCNKIESLGPFDMSYGRELQKRVK